jgi:hypothetical protein
MEINCSQPVSAQSSIHIGKNFKSNLIYKIKIDILNLRTYLLELDNRKTCFTSSQVADLIGQDPVKFASKYDKGKKDIELANICLLFFILTKELYFANGQLDVWR